MTTYLQDVETASADFGSDEFLEAVADILGADHAPFTINEDKSTVPYWVGETYLTHDVALEI